jgi:hypothetical protein
MRGHTRDRTLQRALSVSPYGIKSPCLHHADILEYNVRSLRNREKEHTPLRSLL